MSNNEKFSPILEKKASNISSFFSSNLSWIVISLGIMLRLAQFLFNRSLTEGEAALALNIIERSYAALLKPLDYVQAAPVGFLMLQRSAVTIFGMNDYALRIFPLIAGIVSLLLFYEVAKKTLSKKAVSIALILFAVGDHLIYFASEVKQYSSDVTITLLIILAAIYVLNNNFSIKHMLLFSSVSAISCWFSHPALLTICAATIVLVFAIILNKKWQSLAWLCISVIPIIISFAINYSVFLKPLTEHRELLDCWHYSFMPFPPTSFADIKWFGYVFLRIFKFPVGLSIYELFLAVMSFFFGCIMLFLKKRNILMLLFLPIILTLIASGLQKYPFEGRLLLFITPSMVLIIAAGIDFIRGKVAQVSNILSISLTCLLLVHPVLLAGYHLIKPRAPEELRPIMYYVNNQYQKGDIVYVYYASLNAFKYYSQISDYTYDYTTGIESRSELVNYYKDLRKLKGNKRVWVILSHIATVHSVNEEKLFVSYLNILGSKLDEFKTSGASVYLYNME